MKDVGGAVLAGSTPPFLGRKRAAVDVDVGPERRSPRYHETCLGLVRAGHTDSLQSRSLCLPFFLVSILPPRLGTGLSGACSRHHGQGRHGSDLLLQHLQYAHVVAARASVT